MIPSKSQMMHSFHVVFLLLFVTGLASCHTKPKVSNLTDSTSNGMPYTVFYQGKKAGMRNLQGQVILPAQFDYIEDYGYDHLVLVDSGGHKVEGGDVVGWDFKKYGIVTDQGKIMFRPQFDQVVNSYHMILVKKDSLYGYTTDKGRWIVKPKYTEAYPFEHNAAIVKAGDKYMLINQQGRPIMKQTFDELDGFHNGVTMAGNRRKLGFVNWKGRVIVPLKEDQGTGDFNWNYGKLFRGNKTYLVDTFGHVVPGKGFDTVETYEGRPGHTLVTGKRNGKAVKFEL